VAVWAIVHFQPYFCGQRFILMTDHQPLRRFMEFNKLTGKLARWVLLLQEYNFEVVHRAENTDFDVAGLSCNSNPLDENLTKARWHGDCD
jgi:hypothetical protein